MDSIEVLQGLFFRRFQSNCEGDQYCFLYFTDRGMKPGDDQDFPHYHVTH